MAINPAPLYVAQAVITSLFLALSIAIVGTSAHVLDVFNKQRTSNPWWTPMWPQHFDTSGIKALIASSTVTVVLCSAFFVSSFIPRVGLKQRPTLRALLSLATLVPALLLAVVGVAYSHIVNRDVSQIDTIQTWTCRYKSSRPMAQNTTIPQNMTNASFKSMCEESRFALYGTWVVVLLLVMSTGLTVLAWLAEKWSARQQRKHSLDMVQSA